MLFRSINKPINPASKVISLLPRSRLHHNTRHLSLPTMQSTTNSTPSTTSNTIHSTSSSGGGVTHDERKKRFWGWGWQDVEIDSATADRYTLALQTITNTADDPRCENIAPIPSLESLSLRDPNFVLPPRFATFCSYVARASRCSYGSSHCRDSHARSIDDSLYLS